MTGAGISTHVLDTARGAPATGVAVTLFRREGRDLVAAGSGTTGEDGRVANLLDGELTPGWYQLVFDLATHDSATSSATTHGFTRSMEFLAAAALLAAAISLLLIILTVTAAVQRFLRRSPRVTGGQASTSA